jgi:predicted amidohydrolase
MKKISAIQMTSNESVKDNLSVVDALITKAVDQGSNLVVLPEMFPIAGLESTDKIKVSETLGAGEIQDFLAHQAKKNHLWIVGGTIPLKCQHTDKIRAACLVYNDNGKVVGRYDKIHLFDVDISQTESYQESATTDPGTDITVIDTPLGKLGLSVCYDIRFPELYRRLFNSGAEIFTIPAAFTLKTGQAHWEILSRSRAIENFCYVVGACQTGTHTNGRKTYGHSLIVNPWGEIINSLDDGTDVITAEVNLEKLHQIRKNIPIGEHQKFYFSERKI